MLPLLPVENWRAGLDSWITAAKAVMCEQDGFFALGVSSYGRPCRMEPRGSPVPYW